MNFHLNFHDDNNLVIVLPQYRPKLACLSGSNITVGCVNMAVLGRVTLEALLNAHIHRGNNICQVNMFLRFDRGGLRMTFNPFSIDAGTRTRYTVELTPRALITRASASTLR